MRVWSLKSYHPFSRYSVFCYHTKIRTKKDKKKKKNIGSLYCKNSFRLCAYLMISNNIKKIKSPP